MRSAKSGTILVMLFILQNIVIFSLKKNFMLTYTGFIILSKELKNIFFLQILDFNF